MSFQELSRELRDLFGRGVRTPLPDHQFNELALRVFQFQCRANTLYGAFVERRGVSPGEVASWREIPPVPTRAFKSLPLVAGGLDGVERVFRTSGTTGGLARRGEHHVLDLGLYRASLLPAFQSALLPDGAELPFVGLLPSPEAAPDSSLSFMVAAAADVLGEGPAEFFLGPSGEIDVDGIRQAFQGFQDEDRPVLVAGTAFAFVHFLERSKEVGWRFSLPDGSRILETGGFKGRSRVLSREELYRALEEGLGIPLSYMVNEYGMTELLSQFYEPVLSGPAAGDLAHRFHRPPPWVRSRFLDPATLEPVSPGELGVISHLDLANLGSVMAVLTDDLGREVEGGFQLAGRTPGAEPRGCSLAMEDFLASVGGNA